MPSTRGKQKTLPSINAQNQPKPKDNQYVVGNWKSTNKKKNIYYSYLLQFAIACADKSHSVATVVISCHRGHAIIFVDEERDALNGAGSSQGLVEVLATEVVIYLQRLEDRRKDYNQTRGIINIILQYSLYALLDFWGRCRY